MRRILLLLLAALSLGVTPTSAQDKVGTTGATFLTLPPSARHWGLGGAGAAVVDPFVMKLNPGGLGILALQSQVGAAGNSQEVGPNVPYGNTVVLVNIPVPSMRDRRWPGIALAAAYHRQTLRSKGIPVTTHEYQYGIPGWTLSSANESRNLSLALGVEKGVEFGAGLTFKWLRDEYEEERASSTARDFGIFVRVPFLQILGEAGVDEERLAFGPVEPDLVFAVSYCWANRGDALVFMEEEFPLPRLTRFGWSAQIVLEYRHAEVLHFLITRDDENREFATPEVRHEGCEASLLGVVRYQRDGHWMLGHRETYGVSVHSAGLARWISVLRQSAGKTPLPWMIENLDVFYRMAKIEDGSDLPLRGTEFKEFGFTLNTGPLWR